MNDGENYKPAKSFKSKYSMSSQTLRNWAEAGHIRFLQFNGKHGKCVYLESDVAKHVGYTIKPKPKLRIIYARVSSAKQKEDLERQRDDLISAYPEHDRVITDVGSGVNFNRKGLQAILDLVNEGLVGEVVVMYRDRLARFGIDLLEYIFKQKGVKFLVHSQDASTEPEDILAADLLAITTVFVASHHGKRAGKNRKRRRTGEEETQTVTVKGKEGVQETSPRQDN